MSRIHIDFVLGYDSKMKTKLSDSLYQSRFRRRELLRLTGGFLVRVKHNQSLENMIRSKPRLILTISGTIYSF